MANFDFAFRFMAPHEWNSSRNYTNDPADPGGATKFGVIQKTLNRFRQANPGLDLPSSVADLAEEQAKVIYRMDFWIWDGVRDQRLAAKCFDIGVNMGPSRAVEYLQQSLRVEEYDVAVDGHLGPLTLDATNKANQDALLSHLCAFQRAHYCAWISQNPDREKFRKGLVYRAMEIPR